MAENNNIERRCWRCGATIYRRRFGRAVWEQCLCAHEPLATPEECAAIVDQLQRERPSFAYYSLHGVNSHRVDWSSFFKRGDL